MRSCREDYRVATDTAVMLQVRQGDKCAFEELYGRYHRKLLDFFYAMGRDAQQAEDLCHETFLRLWNLRQRYSATGSVKAYLFTFARYIWLERCRQLKRLRRVGAIPSVADIEEAQLAVVVGGSHPDELAARSELEEQIHSAIDGLPEEQRMVFVMRNIQGLSTEEIAAVLQCPVNTVRSRKILAVKKLRESLRGLIAR